jgi:hypothetical protein
MIQRYPKRRSDVQARLIEGEMVVLDRKAELVHQLNQTATYIWERLDGKTPLEAIARTLVDSFDVDLKSAESDVTKTTEQFGRLNLLESNED